MRLNFSFNLIKKSILIALAVLLGVTGVLVAASQLGSENPLPDNIRRQLDYKAIYPAETSQIDKGSYQYRADKKTLSFRITTNGKEVIFTEQSTPDELGRDEQAYYQALSLRPYAQFRTELGNVALVRFWQSGNLEPAGQSAVLAAGGTLLVASSQKGLTNAEWKDLFDSLKISR